MGIVAARTREWQLDPQQHSLPTAGQLCQPEFKRRYLNSVPMVNVKPACTVEKRAITCRMYKSGNLFPTAQPFFTVGLINMGRG